MRRVLITGGNGQLASSFKDIEKKYKNICFIYTDLEDLDITSYDQVSGYFSQNSHIDFCINCAAFTAVDKAETEIELANRINVIGAQNLARECNKHDVKLIYISTDFVFDGSSSKAYKEDDTTNPLNVYGKTKLDGERQVIDFSEEHFIIRTSWLYSEHGNNFMKTILKQANRKNEFDIVEDQIGTPTYAKDLAEIICKIVEKNAYNYGIYHFSNEGVASWYDFAMAILELKGLDVKVNPVKTENFPTAATRPKFSVLDKTKIKEQLQIEIPFWRDSLKKAITNYYE